MMNDVARILLLAVLGFVALGATGCQAPLPTTISIDPAFSVEDRALIEDAVVQWCEASGGHWCPDVNVGGPGARIVLDLNYVRHGRNPLSGAMNDEADVYVNAEVWEALPVEYRLGTMLHELGHFGVDGHIGGVYDGAPHLMSPSPCAVWSEDRTMCAAMAEAWECIDARSAQEFCEQRGLSGCATTCEEE